MNLNVLKKYQLFGDIISLVCDGNVTSQRMTLINGDDVDILRLHDRRFHW
jgi:hypothetical protein